MSHGKKLINVYCDETCHLQSRKEKVMVLGAVYCDSVDVKAVSEKIREIKRKHGLPRLFETKWTKVSLSKIDYYSDLIEYFFKQSPLKFRAILIPDVSLLDHDRHGITHDGFYYRMYYATLKWLVNPAYRYHFYIDIKDTRGAKRVQKLHEVLANSIYDFNHECISRVQQIKSHESEIMQIADLLIGAVGHANRFERQDTAKMALIDQIIKSVSHGSLSSSSSFGETKFNLFRWSAQVS